MTPDPARAQAPDERGEVLFGQAAAVMAWLVRLPNDEESNRAIELITRLTADKAALREELHWVKRAAELSENIMRDPKRLTNITGEGIAMARRVADQFARISRRAAETWERTK